ncbi:hypothetical protein LDENG_00029640 [Lucifuga dentata]|nr:hypothetical protein LDENG_00029640 [Lucifuga dentata]
MLLLGGGGSNAAEVLFGGTDLETWSKLKKLRRKRITIPSFKDTQFHLVYELLVKISFFNRTMIQNIH